MRGLSRTLGVLFAASVLTAPAWAADITGLTPWACYEFNGSDSNTGSGGRGWNNGSISYTVGVSGGDNTAASINKWTATGNVSTTGGLTVSILATEGATHSTANNNGHLFSLAADNNTASPQWWLRNTGTTGQLKLQGVFTEDLVITLPSGSTDTTFHHYVIAISGDRSSVAVYVDGVAVDTTGKTVNKTASGTGVNANFNGYQVGARWGGGTGSGCVVDDLRIYTATLTPGQVAVLYGKLYANSTAYTRTVSAATADWSATGAWTTGDTAADLPATGSQATLTADVDTTLTLNGLASLSKLTLGGTGSVTAAEGTTGLGSATTVVNTTADLSGVSAGLGALTIATGKTLTVGDATITDIATGNTGSLVVKGNAIYSRTDMGNGNGIAKGRVITVTGSTAVLELSNKDSTGWGYTAGQKFVLTDGGTLKFGSRETFVTPVAMTKGHMVFTTAESERAIDFFNTTTGVDDITVNALSEATVEAPTVSTISSTGTGNARLMLLRDGDLRINVAEKAKLEIDAELTTTTTNAGDTRGKLVKLGDGVLELQGGASSINTGTTVSAGTLVLAGNATLSDTAATKVESGASLVIALNDGATRTIVSAITGDGAVKVTGTGMAAFSTRPTAAVTVTGGSTLKYFVTYDEATAGLTASNVTVESGSSMIFELPNGSTFTGTGENGNTLEPQNFYTWSPTVDSAWDTLGNWTIGGAAASTLPGTDDTVEITLTTATTLTLPEGGVTVQSVAFSGADLTLEGGALTVVAMEVPTSRTLTVQNALTISGEDGLIVNGKLSGAGTVTSSVTFASGSALVLTDDAMPLTISGSISGTIALDATAITPSNVELTKVLSTTQAGQTFTGMPTGFETVQAGQNYYLIKTATKTLTATVSAETAAWNDLTWKNADNEEVAASLFEQVSLSATLTLGESLSSATVTYNVTDNTVPKLAGLTIGEGVVFDIASTSRLNFDVGVVTNNGEMIVRPTVSLEQIYGFPGKVEYVNLTVTGQQVGAKPDELLIRDGDTVNFSGSNLPRYSAPKITMTGGALNLASGSTAFWLGSDTTVNQSGGTVTMNPTSSSASGSGNGLLLGFSGGTTYNLSGGTLDVSNNFLNYWSSSSVNVSGTGLLKVKGVFNGSAAGTLTLADNGTIELTGLQGIPAAALSTLTLSGGKIVAKQNTPIAKAATVGGAVTLSADSEKTLTVSGALSGTGSVTVDGTGIVAFTEANTYAGGTTIKTGANLTLNKENTFSDDTAASRSFTDGHNVTLDAGSTLTLAAGAGFYNVTGSGKVSVSGNYYFGFSDQGGKLEADTLEVSTGAHLYTRGFSQWTPADNKVIQLNTLAISGEIANNGDEDNVISLSVAKTVSGTGSIGLPLTLADGATLDASAGAVTVTKAVTCSGTVTVTLPSPAAAGTTILNCSNPGAIIEKLTGAPTGYKFAATETAVVLAKAGNYTVDGQTFETLEAALASITTGETKTGTITVDASAPAEIPLATQMVVNDVGANITLDLGGKKLVATADLAAATLPEGVAGATGAIWVRQGALTVKNGSLETAGVALRAGVYAGEVAAKSAKLTLEETFSATAGADVMATMEGCEVVTAATLLTEATECWAIYGNGAKNNNTAITITGGSITSTNETAIYHPQGGTLTITGGTIVGTTALYVKGGTVSISGGAFRGTAEATAYVSNGNGASATGDALVVDNDNRYAPLEVSITGGQFSSTNAAPIASYSNVATDVLTGFVSGGKFSQAIAGSLCAKGKCCVKTSGDAFYPWTIGELPAISGGEGGEDVTIDTPEAKDVIGEIIANASATDDAPTAVEVLPGKKSGVALLPEAVADALAIFGSSATSTSTTADGKLTITVSYDFGIDSMEQTDEGIVITAKVQKPNGDAASFANGVTVKLVDETGAELATATPNTNGTATFAAQDPTDLAGKKLKVKASK